LTRRTRRIDIHDFEDRLRRAEETVRKRNPISDRNAELIESFEQSCITEGLSKARVSKYVIALRKLAGWLGKDLDRADKGDIERLVNLVERKPYSAWTKHDYRVTLKKFYRWLRGREEYPPEVRWIKTTMREKDLLLPEEILTEEEVERIVEAANTPRDKAFIITLYESGARVGEVGSMRIRDVQFEESYARLMLRGKTGSRRVPVIAATPYLNAWLQSHPLRGDPDAPLWVNLGTVNQHRAMTYPALAKILRKAAERAGLKKRVTPHKLRHARATFLASKMTEAQMNQIFGWRQGSKMPSIYVHLSGRDLDDAILGVYGLKQKTEEKPKLTPRMCPRCGTSNPYDARFCSKCGLALDPEAAAKLEEARQKVDRVMDVLLRDPEVRRLLEKKIEQYSNRLRKGLGDL